MMSSSQRESKFKAGVVKQCMSFLLLVAAIYACYITSGVYHEKILKHQYIDPVTKNKKRFQQSIIFTLCPPLCGTIIGFLSLKFFPDEPSQSERRQRKPIPFKKAFYTGALVNFNMFTYNQAVIYASFPAVVMVKSCSLLSVILVAVFCSKVKDKNLRLKGNKIIIGVLACVGIFAFNFFKVTEKNSADKAIDLISTGLLIASLIGDGFLPDFQADIKSECKPSVMEMYFHVNKCTFMVALLFCIVTDKLYYIITFFFVREQIFIDVVILSVLNACGQIIIYRMIKAYKQHIPAFVIGIRKCLTVVVNIIVFNHSINQIQIMALCFVFCSIMWETYDNYQEKKQKELESNNSKINQKQQDFVQLKGSSSSVEFTQESEKTTRTLYQRQKQED